MFTENLRSLGIFDQSFCFMGEYKYIESLNWYSFLADFVFKLGSQKYLSVQIKLILKYLKLPTFEIGFSGFDHKQS